MYPFLFHELSEKFHRDSKTSLNISHQNERHQLSLDEKNAFVFICGLYQLQQSFSHIVMGLTVTSNSMLTFRVLPHLNITPRGQDT